ncbi:hypothetical protein ASPSYDRAFT_36654 [Aspergillus sydowii CBS 593.65]|uniref:Uncharacterized protein n=1 Tax=Aspergillus sydowii CBS 593.65 TaxID=1036612 RepID=A0A1L9T102_9EURO|nr:uncharacterized protein ASPSYDRAFT_36654 [Aspergillus sydowii CBS 593.65]OJJ53098.1 hypothetical protein ASPSYDRAFT_36654 [Aspergillus sydowii CBS 593.65]
MFHAGVDTDAVTSSGNNIGINAILRGCPAVDSKRLEVKTLLSESNDTQKSAERMDVPLFCRFLIQAQPIALTTRAVVISHKVDNSSTSTYTGYQYSFRDDCAFCTVKESDLGTLHQSSVAGTSPFRTFPTAEEQWLLATRKAGVENTSLLRFANHRSGSNVTNVQYLSFRTSVPLLDTG